MKFHDDAFSKVNYSEPIFYPPPRLNHVPFKFTKKTRKLAQAKKTQKQYYVSDETKDAFSVNGYWC